MIDDLREIIAINSVEGEKSSADAPFGKELRKALDWFLNKASSYGFKVSENEGYYGYCEYGDQNAPIIGIPVHIDIVPVGEGWTKGDGTTLFIENNTLYGRGVVDDKGPLVAVLWALKRLKAEKVKLRHRVRLIVGCNEESGSECLKKYAFEDDIPKMSIVPDADFPVINSEKGILHLTAGIYADDVFYSSVCDIFAGDRINVVPSKAEVTLNKNSSAYAYLKEEVPNLDEQIFSIPRIALRINEVGAKPSDFKVQEVENGLKITALGVSGHAMSPANADNAIPKLFAFLVAVLNNSNTVRLIYDTFCNKDYLHNLGLYCADECSGELTSSLDMIRYADKTIHMFFDMRLPVCANADRIEQKLHELLLNNTYSLPSATKRIHFSENLYVPESSPLIQTLLSVYAKTMDKRKPKPIQTGGGTYARSLPSAVAFGPTFEGTQTNIHNADENISIEHLHKLVEIYYNAIIALDKL